MLSRLGQFVTFRLAKAVRMPPKSAGVGELDISNTHRSYRLAYRLQNSRFETAPRPNLTLESVFQLPSEPCLLRLVYANDQPQPWRVDGASVTNATVCGSPDGQTADSTLWQRVTFSHRGEDGDPADSIDESIRSLELCANTREVGQPVMAFSDWIRIRANARTDGGKGYLLRVRTHSRDHIRFSGSVGKPDPVLKQDSGGFWIEGDATDGRISGEKNFSDRIFACHGIQYVSATPGVTIIGIGDSIMHSSCTTGELSGFGIRSAVQLSRSECPVSYVSEGYPGRNSLGYITCGKWGILHLRPQAALIQTYSQNEPWTADTADLAFARALDLADFAIRHQCVPIFTTPAPTCERDAQADVHRRRTVERVRALHQSGATVLDLDGIWGTGETPNKYRPDSGCGDTWHPSDRGCARAAEYLTPMLRRTLNLV